MATLNQMNNYDPFLFNCTNKKALEIGGPSYDLHLIGVYQVLQSIDNVNFGSNIWSGEVREGSNLYDCYGKIGNQYVCEATNLSKIESSSYDVVLSCHMLEHIANPIAAMKEFVRVCRSDGYIVLILPIRELTFDHKRNHTTFSHLLQDYENNVQEDDMTHFEEIVLNHDLSRDPEAGSFLNFVKRSLQNNDNRCFHHHVFSPRTILEMFNYCKIDMTYFIESNSYYALGKVV